MTTQDTSYEEDKGEQPLHNGCGVCVAQVERACAGAVQLFLQNFIDPYSDEDATQPKYMRVLVRGQI